MLLDGTLDQLDGIITPTICDTLRPMSQNFRVAMEGKLPCIFLAHPQNRKPAFGLQFTVDQYMHVKGELEKIAGKTITDDDLRAISADALVIWTTKDPSGPVDEGRRIADLLPNGRLEVIENAGHWPQYEQTATFNHVHLDFLRGNTTESNDQIPT